MAQVTEHALEPEDEFLLLGCDGLWDVFSSQRAVEFARGRLQVHNDPAACSRELVRCAGVAVRARASPVAQSGTTRAGIETRHDVTQQLTSIQTIQMSAHANFVQQFWRLRE